MRAAACAFALAWLTGCASLVAGPPPRELDAQAGRRLVLDVPFHPQTENHCGPAALAMVLGWAGDAATPEELSALSYTPGREGALQADLVGAVRRRGSLPYVLDEPGALYGELVAGHPVLVLQNLAFAWLPRWHYAVVIGFDEPRDRVVLHTGPRNARELARATFERTWGRSDHWALVVVPPDVVPATAEESAYLNAAVALESEGEARAFRAATERWPDSGPAWFARGNAEYAVGDLPQAEAAFLRATVLDPDAPAAFNNLAHVRLEQGRPGDALAPALRAVDLGGPLEQTARETLRQIEAALGN